MYLEVHYVRGGGVVSIAHSERFQGAYPGNIQHLYVLRLLRLRLATTTSSATQCCCSGYPWRLDIAQQRLWRHAVHKATCDTVLPRSWLIMPVTRTAHARTSVAPLRPTDLAAARLNKPKVPTSGSDVFVQGVLLDTCPLSRDSLLDLHLAVTLSVDMVSVHTRLTFIALPQYTHLACRPPPKAPFKIQMSIPWSSRSTHRSLPYLSESRWIPTTAMMSMLPMHRFGHLWCQGQGLYNVFAQDTGFERRHAVLLSVYRRVGPTWLCHGGVSSSLSTRTW